MGGKLRADFLEEMALIREKRGIALEAWEIANNFGVSGKSMLENGGQKARPESLDITLNSLNFFLIITRRLLKQRR
jgi:hypothetical protein